MSGRGTNLSSCIRDKFALISNSIRPKIKLKTKLDKR